MAVVGGRMSCLEFGRRLQPSLWCGTARLLTQRVTGYSVCLKGFKMVCPIMTF